MFRDIDTSAGYTNYENSRVSTYTPGDLNKDPGVLVDPVTWKGLKKAKDNIRKNKKRIWISFLMEFVVLLFLAATWSYFINLEA